MIVDSHHHLWDPSRRAYPWIGEALKPIRRRFGSEDLEPLLHKNGVHRTVLVQTVSSGDETRELLGTAAESDFIGGVVGWVDLTEGGVERSISSLRAAPGGGRLAGIRHQVQDEVDPDWLLKREVQRSIAAIGEAGLVYDLLVRIEQLPSALETAKRHPEVQFVLDHAAKPRIAAGSKDSEWEALMTPFADRPNVTCKLSGLITEADWATWTPEQLEPYVRRILGWFGRDRCMFGSDWPVCLLAASYSEVMDAMKAIVGDDDSIFGTTAARVYGL